VAIELAPRNWLGSRINETKTSCTTSLALASLRSSCVARRNTEW